MMLSKEEVGVVWKAMTTTGQMSNQMLQTGQMVELPVERKFATPKLKDVTEIFDQLNKNCIKDTLFVEGELKLSLDQKGLVKECLNGQEWGMAMSKLVLSIQEKLDPKEVEDAAPTSKK